MDLEQRPSGKKKINVDVERQRGKRVRIVCLHKCIHVHTHTHARTHDLYAWRNKSFRICRCAQRRGCLSLMKMATFRLTFEATHSSDASLTNAHAYMQTLSGFLSNMLMQQICTHATQSETWGRSRHCQMNIDVFWGASRGLESSINHDRVTLQTLAIV